MAICPTYQDIFKKFILNIIKIKTMENKSKFFIIIFIILVFLSIAFSYYTFVIKKDFNIFTDEEAFNEALLEE